MCPRLERESQEASHNLSLFLLLALHPMTPFRGLMSRMAALGRDIMSRLRDRPGPVPRILVNLGVRSSLILRNGVSVLQARRKTPTMVVTRTVRLVIFEPPDE